MSITEIAIKRPSLIVVIFAVMGFLGLISYTKLKYELMPKFSIPVVSVTTVYPGASPAEVENSVTKKIEDALANLENLDEIKSISMENVSMVILMLMPDADNDKALQDAQRKVNSMLSDLPEDVRAPSLGKFSFDEAPIMRLGVTAKMPPSDLYALVKDDISPSLAKIEGAAQVSIVGGEEREVQVKVNRERCESFGVSLLQVSQAVRAANMDFPTGKIKGDDAQAMIRLRGKYRSIDEINDLVIANDRRTGSPIRLGEVATVTDGVREVSTYNRINGTNSLGMLITKQTDANAVELSALIKQELTKIETFHKDKGLKFEIAGDTSDFTLAAADSVMNDLMLAIFIVAIVMLLFLHSFRNSLIIMVAIPASLISVFAVMFLMGFSLNLMSLLAISLVVGILVDDSIVVLENIYRHLEKGENRRVAALKGRNEIGFTAMGITLVDVVVFLPITMVGGIISNLLTQFSLVIAFSTLMSLFVSFTLTPLLASRLSKVEHLNPKRITGRIVIAFEGFLNYLTNRYIALLNWSLRHKRWVIIGTVVTLIASFSLITKGYIGSEFVSQGDRGEFVITLELPQDATLAQTNDVAQQVEEYLFHREDVTNVFTTVGSTSQAFQGSSSATNKAELTVKLVPKEERPQSADILAQVIKQDLEKQLPDVKVNSAAVSITGSANQAPIQVSVTSNSVDTNLVVASRIVEKLKSIPGTAEVKLSIESGNPEVTVDIDRERMAELGLTMDMVGGTMQVAFNGNTDSKYSEDGKDYRINIVYDEFNRKRASDVENIAFINTRGESVRLAQFATIGHAEGPSRLERKNRIPSIEVSSQVLGISSGEVTAQMEEYFKSDAIPTNVTVQFEGNAKNMGEAFANLGFALIASILFVYLIMVALYDSYIYPFVVLFSIPVAVVGALLALALSMQPLSIFSILGMIMLIGLVAKNAILIVDFANQRKADGLNTVEALLEAGRTRLRPILMTTLSMISGMMPIALAHGAGAEWKSGLAWVLIGGLSSSMLLTLVVVPCVYLIIDIFKREITNRKAKTQLRELRGTNHTPAVTEPEPMMAVLEN